jgi:DNA-binding response OmpR family regulator
MDGEPSTIGCWDEARDLLRCPGMWRILLVDDDAKFRAAVRANLERVGHTVHESGNGFSALALARTVKSDVAVLDVNLPDTRGTTVCQRMKGDEATSTMPVIMATACADEETKVEAFELGADDYLVKPFSFRELLLRMRVLLEGGTWCPAGVLRLGALTLDFDACRATVDGTRIDLSKAELTLLGTLSDPPQRVWTRDELLDSIWGVDSLVDHRVVDGLVRRVREKLGAHTAAIETVRRVGYRLADGRALDRT